MKIAGDLLLEKFDLANISAQIFITHETQELIIDKLGLDISMDRFHDAKAVFAKAFTEEVDDLMRGDGQITHSFGKKYLKRTAPSKQEMKSRG